MNERISNKTLGIFLSIIYIPIICFFLFLIGLSKVDAKSFDSYLLRGFDVNGTQLFRNTSGFVSYSNNDFRYAILTYNMSGVNAGSTLTFNINPISTFSVSNVNTQNISLSFTINAITTSGTSIDIRDYCSGTSVKSTDYENNSFTFNSVITCTYPTSTALSSVGLRYVIGGSTSSVKGLVINQNKGNSSYTTDPGEGELIIQNANENANRIINNQNANTDKIIDALTGGKLDDDTPVDTSGLNDYEQNEGALIDEDSLNNINNIDISIDSNTSTFFWDLFTRIINTHTLIYGLVISVLSLGVVKLILNR
uniref:Uncharacterized protein n=1 Tax=Dulem virus 71 TaxID=3145782 RepID=A0AAU8AXH3_9VIRU